MRRCFLFAPDFNVFFAVTLLSVATTLGGCTAKATNLGPQTSGSGSTGRSSTTGTGSGSTGSTTANTATSSSASSSNSTGSTTVTTSSSTGSSGGSTTGAVDAGQAETVGVGDINQPAVGPPPTEAGQIGGADFVLVKNWDFGTQGTIRDVDDLIAEFQFHDQFNTIANGTNYGAVIVAPNAATAIHAGGLGLPNDMQPVEDPTRPNREWTSDSLLAHVLPLSASQTTATVTNHDTGNGSFMAKWNLPSGGSLLGEDLLWETRARMPAPLAAYWFALWTSGNRWDHGAEMDVLESFGTPNVTPLGSAFHVNSVGGTDTIDYSSWPNGLTQAGVPTTDRDLRDWHTWSWLYRKDDSYVVYYDGYVVQTGQLIWTYQAVQGGQSIDMDFLFDFSWGHTQISQVNISLPASDFPLTYEIDYSRVYLRP